MSTKCIWCPTILPVFVCGAKHCYIGRQSQDSRQDQPISKQMSSTAHELHIIFSTRHWRGKGIKRLVLESSSCQIFTVLGCLAKCFLVKHGYAQPIATMKIFTSKTQKEHLQIKERRWIPFDVFAPPKEKRSPGEPSSGWIVIPHLISVGLVLYCGGPLFTWLSIYLRRESC